MSSWDEVCRRIEKWLEAELPNLVLRDRGVSWSPDLKHEGEHELSLEVMDGLDFITMQRLSELTRTDLMTVGHEYDVGYGCCGAGAGAWTTLDIKRAILPPHLTGD